MGWQAVLALMVPQLPDTPQTRVGWPLYVDWHETCTVWPSACVAGHCASPSLTLGQRTGTQGEVMAAAHWPLSRHWRCGEPAQPTLHTPVMDAPAGVAAQVALPDVGSSGQLSSAPPRT
jgi:hypothetical protein